MKVFILLSVVIATASARNLCACPRIYDPVCGNDGVTHDNECTMTCAGATQVAMSECKERKGCACGFNLLEVCGKDGETYPNECVMECAGVEKDRDGACDARKKRDACHCPEQLELPVCANNGITYNSMCELGCAQGVFRFLGQCDPTPAPTTPAPTEAATEDTMCTMDYTPVCGDDGVTYGNMCMLNATENVNLAAEGECTTDDNRRKRAAAAVKICHADYTPVCGDDGVTYGNLCMLNATENVNLAAEGECTTVGNRRKRAAAAEAEAAATAAPATTAAPADQAGAKCSCPNQLDMPICGKDGVTYNNMCALGCGGAEFRFLGHCPVTLAPETTAAATTEAAATTTATGADEDALPCVGDDCGDDD